MDRSQKVRSGTADPLDRVFIECRSCNNAHDFLSARDDHRPAFSALVCVARTSERVKSLPAVVPTPPGLRKKPGSPLRSPPQSQHALHSALHPFAPRPDTSQCSAEVMPEVKAVVLHLFSPVREVVPFQGVSPDWLAEAWRQISFHGFSHHRPINAPIHNKGLPAENVPKPAVGTMFPASLGSGRGSGRRMVTGASPYFNVPLHGQ